MTLNDEQQKALRAWWKAVDDMSGKRGNPALFALIESLRPLMEPWRVMPSQVDQTYCVVGPYGERIAVHTGEWEQTKAIADKVAALLNESESSR